MNPSLIFENVFDQAGTLTASSEAAGYPKENVNDWRLATPYRWKPSSTTPPATLEIALTTSAEADTLVIGGHTLSDAGARYKLQYWTGAAWSDAFASVTPSDNATIVKTLSVTGAKSKWRLYLDTASGNFTETPAVGILTVGRRLTLERGAMPGLDVYGETPIREFNRNRDGQPLGASLQRIEKTFALEYPNVGMSESGFFAPSSGLTFRDDAVPHLRDKPCWFAWNLDSDLSAFLCWAEGKIGMPFAHVTSRQQLSMTLRGIAEILT